MDLERIVKKLFLGGTLAVALVVSMMSVGTFAADKEVTGDAAMNGVTNTTTFSMTVGKAITLSGVAMSGDINADLGSVATGILSATVQSNAAYTISLSADTPALTSGSGTIPASSNLVAGTSGWGIKKKGSNTTSNTTDDTTYTGMTISPVQFYSSSAAASKGVKTDFAVGVAVAPTQAADTYTTAVTVTAALAP